MKRITVEMVKEAYANTGLSPKRGSYYESSCACALGAIYTSESGCKEEGEADNYAIKLTSRQYVSGFVNGFDGNMLFDKVAKVTEWQQGYEDGRAAWEAVKP